MAANVRIQKKNRQATGGLKNLFINYPLPLPAFIAAKYLLSSSFTFGNKKNKPTIFGNTIPSIIASEKLITEFNVADAPITTKARNKSL
jgi:hypothetical protein